jgi:hypothetical protein
VGWPGDPHVYSIYLAYIDSADARDWAHTSKARHGTCSGLDSRLAFPTQAHVNNGFFALASSHHSPPPQRLPAFSPPPHRLLSPPPHRLLSPPPRPLLPTASRHTRSLLRVRRNLVPSVRVIRIRKCVLSMHTCIWLTALLFLVLPLTPPHSFPRQLLAACSLRTALRYTQCTSPPAHSGLLCVIRDADT